MALIAMASICLPDPLLIFSNLTHYVTDSPKYITYIHLLLKKILEERPT